MMTYLDIVKSQRAGDRSSSLFQAFEAQCEKLPLEPIVYVDYNLAALDHSNT